MNRTLLLLLFHVFWCSQLAQAQEALLVIAPNRISKEVIVNAVDAEFEEISTITLTNRSNRSLQLRWEKSIEGMPRAWETLVCSKSPNTVPFTGGVAYGTTEDRSPIRLGPGESADFYLVLRPNGVVGKGRLNLSFASIIQPSKVLATAIFDFNVARRATAEEPDGNRPKVLRVYPNPSVNEFFVEYPAGVVPGKVEVFNTLGRRLKTFAVPVAVKATPSMTCQKGFT
ncbi:MAG: T9SS type A sorting domain-containing protein [Lewinella sp.]|nr:T9SS type A sorting domain-containing protein [Lewinella sp.]